MSPFRAFLIWWKAVSSVLDRVLEKVGTVPARPAALVMIGFAVATGGSAAPVKMRLVRADAPGERVGTAVTEIDLEAERARLAAGTQQRASAGGTKGALAGADEEKLKPRAEFDRYCNYMRGIVIDGRHPFQRMYEGSFLGRSDEIALELEDGEHRIDPGHHVFQVRNGQVATDDPTMAVRDGVLQITLYPVTVIAMDGSSVRPMPAEVLRLPVTPRLFWKSESLVPREEMVAENATFKRITLYMMANRTGSGYLVSPSERNFHVGPEGVILVDSAGQPTTDRGVYVEGRFTIVLPKMTVPVHLRGQGMTIRIAGPAGSFSATTTTDRGETLTFQAFSALDGANIRFGRKAENGPHLFPGDFGAWPRRRLLFDGTDPQAQEPRMLSVALPGGSVEAGKALRVRIEVVDAMDRATITPFEPFAFLLKTPVLLEDATLQSNPGPATPDAEFRQLTVRGTDIPDVYDLEIPADLASNIYFLRLGADRRGQSRPSSPLAIDMVQGVVNPASATTLWVFCPAGRHAFFRGADLPLTITLKSSGEFAGGALKLSLRNDRGELFPLIDQPLAACAAGQQSRHFVLEGSASAALRPGRYVLVAECGPLQSNQWPVELVEPRDRAGAAHYHDGWLAPNFDLGAEYLNRPLNITAVNQKRSRLDRQAAIRSAVADVQVVDWSGFAGAHANYGARDNASEVAEIEMMLRGDLRLPAAEVYYSQNNFEAINEALIRHGEDLVTSTPCFIAILSLIHSIPDQVDAKMRQAQLITQIGEKFESFIGINHNFMLTKPLGDMEIPDPTRYLRLQLLEERIRKEHGVEVPPMNQVVDWFDAKQSGRPPVDPSVEQRWAVYQTVINRLMAEYHENIQRSIGPLPPGLFTMNRGVSHVGETTGGNYPELANANQAPLSVFTGNGDTLHDCMWEPYLKTMFFGISGNSRWGTDGALAIAPMLKHNLGMFLMGGATGYGYLGGGLESGLPWKGAGRTPQEMLDIREFLERYGPWLRHLQHRGEVAVFYPFHQSMFDDANLARSIGQADTVSSLRSALLQLAMLGYTPQVVTERTLEAGELDRYPATLIPYLTYLLPEHLQKLEEYAAGHRLMVGGRSSLVPKGAGKLENDFMELATASLMWSVQGPWDMAHAWVQSEMRRKAPELRRALEPAVRPAARPRENTLLLNTFASGDATFSVVCNFLYPSFMGTERLSSNPLFSGPYGEAAENTIMPQKPALEFPADRAIYDLFTQAPLSAPPREAGTVGVECDLSFTPFRILASLPEPVARLRVEAPKQIALGRTFLVQVIPLNAAGRPLNVGLPIAVAAADGRGESVPTVYGVSLADQPVRVSASLGYRPGQWKLTIRELVSGRQAETIVNVTPPAALPLGERVVAVPPVDVQRANLVRSFLADRRQDKAPVLVLLDEAQKETRSGVAAELTTALQALGVKAEIRTLDSPGVFAPGERMKTYGRFVEMNPQQYVNQHIALIGGEGENLLIEELQEIRPFPRSMTAAYPGPGRAAITLVRSPFAYMKDVLCVFGPDEDGLRAGIAALKEVEPAPAPAAGAAAGTEIPRTAQDLEGTVQPDSYLATRDGSPTLTVIASPAGDRIAFGLTGYARNIFVFDQAGQLRTEELIGHVHVPDIQFIGNSGQLAVSDTRMTYLREPDGRLRWRLGNRRPWTRSSGVSVDPRGRYVVQEGDGRFAVLDLSLQPLWSFDEWDQYESTKEMVTGRTASFLGSVEDGQQIVYRLEGRAPGLAGRDQDLVVFADALTGQVQKQFEIDLRNLAGDRVPWSVLDLSLSLVEEGRAFYASFDAGRYPPPAAALLDREGQIVLREEFVLPEYFGTGAKAQDRLIVWDRRQAVTVGNMLCLSDPQWKSLSIRRTESQILSLAVDQARRRLAVSNYAGQLFVVDENLETIWETRLDGAARLAFLPGGQLAAGTVRGVAQLFSPSGELLWERSMNRYLAPEEIDQRWAELEAVPTSAAGALEPWWVRIQEQVELGSDQAKLSGRLAGGAPAEAEFAGEPFGTYLVEWRTGEGRDVSFSLAITESEKPLAGNTTPDVQRVTLSARPGPAMVSSYALLRLGDRPHQVKVRVTAAGSGEALNAVSIRPLQFPSKDVVRMEALYRGIDRDALYVDPPARVQVFCNVREEGAPHDALKIMPEALVNGRMLEPERELKKGLWWGRAAGAEHAEGGLPFAIMPSWVEITLPRKRVITHVVVAEDPSLERVGAMAVDAYLETRETRRNVTEDEKRAVPMGYWHTLAKLRDNDSPYNILRFPKPVYTSKVRVYLLKGLSSVNEIELYGALPPEARE